MSKQKETFDDETLVKLAKSYFRAGCYDNNAVRVLNEANSTLSVAERNTLVRYVDKYHNALFKSMRSGLSMRQMRDGLLKKIGAEALVSSGCEYAGNINAVQLRAIYNYVMEIEELNEEA